MSVTELSIEMNSMWCDEVAGGLHLGNHLWASHNQVNGTETLRYGEKREAMWQHVAINCGSGHTVIFVTCLLSGTTGTTQQ